MKLKNMNLLVSRLEAMLDDPDQIGRFDMGQFGRSFSDSYSRTLNRLEPVCKTSACLAGETVLATGSGQIRKDAAGKILGGIVIPGIDGQQSMNIAIWKQAQKDLGLTLAQVDRLFFFKGWARNTENFESVTITTGWPKPFQKMYEQAQTQQGRIYAAIKRVQFFIKTKGTDKGKI